MNWAEETNPIPSYSHKWSESSEQKSKLLDSFLGKTLQELSMIICEHENMPGLELHENK